MALPTYTTPLAGQGEIPSSPVDQTVSGYTPGSVDYSITNPGQSSLDKQVGEAIPGMGSGQFGSITNGQLDATSPVGADFNSVMKNGITAGKMKKLTKDITGGIGNVGVLKFGVRLTSRVTGESFFCDVMPQISEQGSVTYSEIDIIQHPGTILKYQTTPSREWSITNIKLVSLTAAEATKNQDNLNLIRTWRMPYYGSGTGAKKQTKDKLGAPPDVLWFSAYGMGNIDKMPVVLTSASWDWANDVDYVHTLKGEPFPVLMTISLSIKEAWSPREFSGFDINAFRSGNLTEAYKVRDLTRGADKSSNATSSSAKGEAPKDKTLKPPTGAAQSVKPEGDKGSAAAISSGETKSCTAAEAAEAELMPTHTSESDAYEQEYGPAGRARRFAVGQPAHHLVE